jgi:hypothetical protein
MLLMPIIWLNGTICNEAKYGVPVVPPIGP